MKSLYFRVMQWRFDQQNKHDLGYDYAEKELNKLSHTEFLQELSNAIEDMFDELKEAKK